MADCEVITELSRLDHVEAAWDRLAVGNRLPLMAPACVMAWWRELAPPRAVPCILAIRDGEELVGLAPFYVDPDRPTRGYGLRLPGIELGGRLAPLAAAGRERTVAGALSGALAALQPSPALLTLEGMPLTFDWPAALRGDWPGELRPSTRRFQVSGCPTVSLAEGSFDRWLAGKSSNFRGGMRRLRRQFLAAGGTMRSSTPATLSADVETFVRLHAARWEGRGGSNFVRLGDSLKRVLNDIGRSLLEQEGRFRMRVLEVEGEPVSAQLFLAGGGHVLYINGGWDVRFARLKPSILGILAVIEEAFERGDEVVDLGLGEQHYKQRFSDGNEPLAWTILIPAGRRRPLTLLNTAPMLGQAALRSTMKAHLSERQLMLGLRLRERMPSLRPKSSRGI